MRYVLGLDIGIASVGWAVLNLDRNRIENLGVRMFNKAENPKDGAPLAEPRRLARSMRRRLQRRAGRLRRIKVLLVRNGLIPEESTEAVFLTVEGKPTPWQLRAEGLDRRLTGEEFARALFHLAKRRGFKSNRKGSPGDAVKSAKDEEEGRILAGVRANRELMAEKGYRTAGEMFFRDEKFHEHKRNAGNAYGNTVDRALLQEEARMLFAAQRALWNPSATDALEEEFISLSAWQMPVASGDAILAKVGKCTFEPAEKRAPRNAYTGERFTLLSKVNHLAYYDGGDRQFLSPDQRRMVVEMAYRQAEVKYSQIRKALSMPEGVRFVGLSYTRRVGDNIEEGFDCEKATFCKLNGYHELRKLFEADGLWDQVKDDHDLLDDLAFALTFYKTEEDIRHYLQERGISEPIIEVTVQSSGFSKIIHLSLVAMRKILPYFEQGMIYSDACKAAGYDHTAHAAGQRSLKLPTIDTEEIRNPVVLRALTQARKVVNAVTTRYGAPYRIHIELAREMGKTFKERGEIEKRQLKNRDERATDEVFFRSIFPACDRVTGEDLLKWRLYREQNGQCAYSQHPLELARLLEPGYVELDHILPYSRSFDDGMANKALVLSVENQRKKNRTPHEYFGHDDTRWTSFEAWVTATIRDARKRRNLLVNEFDARKEEEWKERNLVDTQYIARYFSNFLRDNLLFSDEDKKVRVVCIKGQVTSMVRGLWGLAKARKENDLHHAVDAAVVATLTPKQVQRITEYRQARETLAVLPDGAFVDPETGEEIDVRRGRHFTVPKPWPHFREELLARLTDNPAAALAEMQLQTYEDLEARPVLVSRMPQRKIGGAIHQETIRSAKWLASEGVSAVRTPLTSLKPADLGRLVAPETNEKLYAAIRARLEQFDDNAQKAFGDPENPLRKPTNDGSPGPIVRSVKVASTQNAGVPVRGGIANNGDMIRIDVFQRNGKYYLTPVYVADLMQGRLPNRSIKAGKQESDWPIIDDTYVFLFTLYPYELLRIVTKRGEFFGYYKQTNRNTGNILLCPPNHSDAELNTCITTALNVEKYHVDMLGNIFPVAREVRRGLESGVHRQPVEIAD